jgi:transposase
MMKHSEEFKQEAVRIALTSGLSRERVAKDLGIGKSTLGKWLAQYRPSDLVSAPQAGALAGAFIPDQRFVRPHIAAVGIAPQHGARAVVFRNHGVAIIHEPLHPCDPARYFIQTAQRIIAQRRLQGAGIGQGSAIGVARPLRSPLAGGGERTPAWLNRNLCPAKDFEQIIASATAWLFMVSIQPFTRSIARA